MKLRHWIGLVITVPSIGLLACSSSELLALPSLPTATPTFILARFATSTFTPEPTTTLATEPTEVTANTPVPSPTVDDETATPTPAEPEVEDALPESPLATPTPTPTPAPTEPPLPPTATPTETLTPTPAPLAGRIAFPVDNGGGRYDVWVVELPAGEPFLVQAGARQPNFSGDGRLLVNLQDSDLGESVGLIDTNYTPLGVINDSPDDAFPYWHPDGQIYSYSNMSLLLDPASGNPLPHVFIPCSLQIPSLENNDKCRDIQTRGKVIVGEAPVWTDDDRIAFFSFEGDDGIYVITSASALWQAGGVGQRQLLVNGNGRPTDTDGFQVYFSAGDIDGNWEAYAIDLDGTNLTNLSNAPLFQDGLPTVSPDGNWVAFVSDRDGSWGIWVVPRSGGEPKKVVDLAKINTNPSPWGVGDRAWMMERLSWGPPLGQTNEAPN
jgi:hypothetical protein